MPAGLTATLTKATVDQLTGTVAQRLNQAFLDVATTKSFLDVHDDAALEALGYSPADVAAIRSAYADLDQLRTIYVGAADLAAAKDFRVFASRIWGVGFST